MRLIKVNDPRSNNKPGVKRTIPMNLSIQQPTKIVNPTSWNTFVQSMTEEELHNQALLAQACVFRAKARAKHKTSFPMSVLVFYDVLGQNSYRKVLDIAQGHWLYTNGQYSKDEHKSKRYSITNGEIFEELLQLPITNPKVKIRKQRYAKRAEAEYRLKSKQSDNRTRCQLKQLHRAFELVKSNLDLIENDIRRKIIEQQLSYGFWVTISFGRIYSAFHAIPSTERSKILSMFGYNSFDLSQANLMFLGIITDNPEFNSFLRTNDLYSILGNLSHIGEVEPGRFHLPHDVSRIVKISPENKENRNWDTMSVRDRGKLRAQYFINSNGTIAQEVSKQLSDEYRFKTFVSAVKNLKSTEAKAGRKGAWHPCQLMEHQVFRVAIFDKIKDDYIDMHDGFYSKITKEQFISIIDELKPMGLQATDFKINETKIIRGPRVQPGRSEKTHDIEAKIEETTGTEGMGPTVSRNGIIRTEDNIHISQAHCTNRLDETSGHTRDGSSISEGDDRMRPLRRGNTIDTEQLALSWTDSPRPVPSGDRGRDAERILNPKFNIREIQLLCACCHMKKTARERNNWRLKFINEM